MTTRAIPVGSRNIHLTQLAGQLRRQGLSAASMLAVLQDINAQRCSPPLSDGEVAKIAQQAAA